MVEAVEAPAGAAGTAEDGADAPVPGPAGGGFVPACAAARRFSSCTESDNRSMIPSKSSSTHGNALGLFVHVKDLLLGLGVEAVHPAILAISSDAAVKLSGRSPSDEDSPLADRGPDQLRVVLPERSSDALALVDLLGLVDNGRSLLPDFARDGLIFTNDPLADIVVDRVEEVEEAGRDALFFCRVSAVCFEVARR